MDLQETLGGNVSFGLSYHFPGELHLTFSSTELNSLQLCLCKENQTLIRFNGVPLKRAECIKLNASGLWYAPSYFGLRLVHHPIIRPTSPADLTMALLSKIQECSAKVFPFFPTCSWRPLILWWETLFELDFFGSIPVGKTYGLIFHHLVLNPNPSTWGFHILWKQDIDIECVIFKLIFVNNKCCIFQYSGNSFSLFLHL